jgi:alpha-2-macroglobulin
VSTAENSAGSNADDNEGDAAPAKGPAASATVAYMVRAVTPGAFVHPAATVEDMYHPQRYARSAAGKLTVAPSE